jgi:hypothetical protein
MNRNTVRTFFNMLEIVAIEHTLSFTPGNIFKIDDSCIQIYNKPGSLITEKGPKIVHVLTSGGKSENTWAIQ